MEQRTRRFFRKSTFSQLEREIGTVVAVPRLVGWTMTTSLAALQVLILRAALPLRHALQTPCKWQWTPTSAEEISFLYLFVSPLASTDLDVPTTISSVQAQQVMASIMFHEPETSYTKQIQKGFSIVSTARL